MNQNNTSFSIGEKVYNSIIDVKKHAEQIRKMIASINQEEQDLCDLSNQLSKCCQECAKEQFPCTHLAIDGFSSTISKVESARNTLFRTIFPISEHFLKGPDESAMLTISDLKKREQAFAKVKNLPPIEKDLNANKNTILRREAMSTNNVCINSIKNWNNQYHTDLKRSLREYAFAQVQFASRSLEIWSNFSECLAIIDFYQDTDDVITLLEDGKIPTAFQSKNKENK